MLKFSLYDMDVIHIPMIFRLDSTIETYSHSLDAQILLYSRDMSSIPRKLPRFFWSSYPKNGQLQAVNPIILG